MKKSNVVIFVLLVVASAFFLWLWYFLGLNRIDEPLDLVLSVVWWVVVAAAVAVIVKMERTRRQRIRTVYVGEGAVFNSETGLVKLEEQGPTLEALAAMLRTLKYDFSRQDFPDKEDFDVRYFVRTKKFDVEQTAADASRQDADAQGRQEWKGEVFVVETKEERAFESPEELAGILATLGNAA